jgi:hypothetical protein
MGDNSFHSILFLVFVSIQFFLLFSLIVFIHLLTLVLCILWRLFLLHGWSSVLFFKISVLTSKFGCMLWAISPKWGFPLSLLSWFHFIFTLRTMLDLSLGVWKDICPNFLQMFMLFCRIWLICNCGLLFIDKFKLLNTWSHN